MASVGTGPLRPRGPSSPLADFIEGFLAPGRRLKEKTRSDYGRYLRRFDEFTGHTELRTALTFEHAEQFRDRYAERGPYAAHNATMALRSLARWLARTNVLPGPNRTSILEGLSGPTLVTVRRNTLTNQDFEFVLRVIADRDQRERLRAVALVRLLWSTGIGIGAAYAIQRRDVEFDETGGRATLHVRRKSAKSDPTNMRLDRDTTAALRAYIDNERPKHYLGDPPQPLFLTEDATAFEDQGFGSWVARLTEQIHRETGIRWNAMITRRTWQARAKAPFRDPDLMIRCSEIIRGNANYDQAVFAACQVLEVRVRDLTAAERRSAAGLMEFAFDPATPQLTLSTDASEQRGVMEMYAGLMRYYRNPTTHRIRQDIDRDDAIRIVTWVDHLLTLLDQAQTTKST